MAGIEGSFEPRRSQTQANTGDSRITQIGGTDWSQEAGISQAPIIRSVSREAKRLNEEPACSYPAQKRDDGHEEDEDHDHALLLGDASAAWTTSTRAK